MYGHVDNAINMVLTLTTRNIHEVGSWSHHRQFCPEVHCHFPVMFGQFPQIKSPHFPQWLQVSSFCLFFSVTVLCHPHPLPPVPLQIFGGHVRTQKMANCKPRSEASRKTNQHFDLGPQPWEPWESKSLLLNHPVCDIMLLKQP